jgi:hypothetical protein
VQKQYHDVVVSTYGRGIYILSDITPLEQGVVDPTFSEAAHLVAPRPAFREVRAGRAEISYVLKTAPKSPIEVEVLDAKGALVRKLPPVTTAHAGLNRLNWDLHYEAPRTVALRTTPPENPHIWEEPRFNPNGQPQDTRAITHWGLAQAEVGPIAAPGKYTVRLNVDGQTLNQPLEILLPPDSHGKDADIQASVKLQLKVRDDITTAADMTNQIEWMRKQLEDQKKANQGKPEVVKSMDAIDRKLQDVEFKIISQAEALSDDKYFQTAYRIYLNLIWLNGEIGTGAGDVAGSADYGPTETSVGLVLDLERQLGAVQTEYKSVMEKDVPSYNNAVSGSGVAPLKTTGAPPPPIRQGGRFGG